MARLGGYFLHRSTAARHPARQQSRGHFLPRRRSRALPGLAGGAAAAYRCAIHAYVLMINHVHLLVTADEECLPRAMQSLGRLYRRRLRADGDAVGRPLLRGTHR